MRKLSLIALFTLLILSTIFAKVGDSKAGGEEPPKLIDLRADIVFPHKISDSITVICLVGNFAAQHNGAIITADSAVRYNDDRLECFGNVLINKNTTYAYADEAAYNAETNLAKLIAPIVKVVDEDVTLNTYNFEFNTLTSVGRYWGGGVTIKKAEPTEEKPEPIDDMMESVRGYYDANLKQVIGAERVEMRGEGYVMKSDSVIYEMEGERAIFFDSTNIWSDEEDYIYGDAGLYNKGEAKYEITRNGYLLRPTQEAWGDTLEYYSERKEAILRGNIQLDDTKDKSMAFGDYAQYWGNEERVLLTKRPAVINYDTTQADSLFLRADTIKMLSYPMGTGPLAESTAQFVRQEAEAEEIAEEQVTEEPVAEEAVEEESIIESDSIAADTTLTKRAIRRAIRAEKRAAKKAKSEAESAARKAEYEAKNILKINAERAREYRRLAEKREKVIERIEERRAKGRNIYTDSLMLIRLNKEMVENDTTTVVKEEAKEELRDTTAVAESIVADSVEQDSLYRVITAYRNARTYRSDFQSVSDSMVGVSIDSMMKLFVEPIIWSEHHQISCTDQVDLYSFGGELDYVEFVGDPIMSSQVMYGDTTHFNQVSGKQMFAFFENNNVVRNDVDGNVQTIYYMRDDETGEVNTIAYIESGTASFFIERNELDGVTYRAEPTYVFAPLDKMPEDMSMYLPNFKWVVDERPTREAIFDRDIRASLREERSVSARPTFPILKRVNVSKKRYESKGLWYDRSEGVSPDAAEWMRSLGYTVGEPRPAGSNPF